jgi:carboxyl-terminal processing protease
MANEHGQTKEQKNQSHFVLGGRSNHFVLTHNPEVMPKVTERLDKLDAMVKNGKLPAKLEAEARQLLERMPRLEYQRNLRKEYQQLVDGKQTPKEFETQRDTILEGTRIRDVDAVRFAKKIIEASSIIKDSYVKEVNQGELVGWGIKGLYRKIDEKIPAELEAKLKKVKTMNEEELTTLLAEVRRTLGMREDLDKHKDLDITLQKMLSQLDPYTTYIDPETLDKFRQEIRGNFKGIGIQIRKDNATDMLLVVTPIKNSPAYKAGIQAGDIVTKITCYVDKEGKALAQPEELSTKGLALSDAVKKILGKAGTKVKLTVQREGESKLLDFDITRGLIEVETVLGHKRDTEDDWDYLIDRDNKIGYIRLTQFSENSYRDLELVMRKLTRQGIKGFVLDLRFNPGGLLNSAVDITDLFISDGLIVSIKPRVGRPHKFHGKMAESLLDFPMVCLVNGYSASGSEIVSAALQDHNRAWIVGERSYGKGSVQNIQKFEGGEIKMTTASFWRPNGKNLNKSSTTGKDEDEWGVMPDKEVKLSRKEREDLADAQRDAEIIIRKGVPPKETKTEFKDKQLDEALNYLRNQIKLGARTPQKKVG